nr:MAG TPA: minor tail protein [Caudoviricetes sp.]
MVVAMADVDITSLSVEISAESQGAELNIDKLTTAISNLRTKGSVGKVCTSLDKLSSSISALKQASAGISGLDKVTNFLNGISSVNTNAGVKGVNSVVNAIKKIPNAVSALNGVDFYSMSGSITQLTNALAPLSILDISGLKSLGSAFKAIGTVPDLTDKLKAADLDSFADSCQKISAALTPLASQLETVGNAFAKLPPQLSKVVTQANRVTAANERQKKSYMSLSNQLNGFMRSAAKLVSLKAIATYLGNAAEKFNSYYEAANLFGVSMKGLTGEASTFINKMETLLGIDPTEAMNNMATIQSLTTSFGLASDKAYVLSKNLTQLGYDLASLKNIPVAESFTKIQAAISGELEPIRRLGVDISNARLQQELLNLGYSQSVSTLSQADKAVLRYIAIMKQTTDAQGDFARTLSSPANMIRILQAQLNSLARAVGSLLYPALKSILPPLIAAVELVKELVTGIASLMGVKVEFPDFSSASDAVGGVTDAMDNTTKATGKAAKAFKNYIMGFDELNVIQKDNGSSGGSGSGAGAAGNLLGDVDLSGYDMFKNYVGSSVDEIKAKLEKLLPLISGIAAGFATWAISNSVLTALEKIKGEGSLIEAVLKLWKNPIMAAAVAVGIIVARFVSLYQNSEKFRKGLERVRALVYLAAEGFKQGWNISLTDGKLGESIEYLKESLSNLGQSILNLLPESWQEGITSAFDSISKVAKKLDLDVWDLVTTLAGIGLIVSDHPVASLAVIGFEAISVAVRGLGSENQKTAFGMETDWFNSFKSIGESVANFAAAAVTAIGNIINDIAIFVGWIKNGVSETDRLDLQMNGNFIENFVMGIAQTIHNIGVFVGWITSGVDEADRLAIAANGNFAEKFILLIADVINGIKEAVKWFGKLIEKISKFNPVSVGKNIIDGIAKGIVGKKNVADDAVKAVTDGIQEEAQTELGIHSPSKVFKGYGVYLIEGLVNGVLATKNLAVKAIQSVSDAVKTIGSQLADDNYGLRDGSISLSVDASGKSMMETANALKRTMRTTNDSFGGWFKKMKTDLGDFTEGVDAVTKAGKDISNGFKSSVDALTAASKSILNTHDGFVSAVSDIHSFVKKSVAEIENEYQYNGFFGAAGLAIQKAFEGVYLVFNKVSTAVKNVSDTIDSVKNVITTFNNLKTKVGEVIDQVPALKQAYGGLKSFFNDLFNKDSGIGKIVSDGFDFIKTKAGDVANWFKEKLNIGSSGSSAGGGSLGALGSTAASGGALSHLGAYGGIGAGVGLGLSGGIQWWKDMIGTLGDSDKSSGTKVLESIKHTLWDLSPIGALVNLGKKIFGFASGGFPDAGQLFIAREAGAEMVGSLGGHTAVANNDQIVDGIREGVEAAMERQNQLLRRQNELLQALLEKEGSAEINVSSFYQAVNRTNQRNGKTIIPVGT